MWQGTTSLGSPCQQTFGIQELRTEYSVEKQSYTELACSENIYCLSELMFLFVFFFFFKNWTKWQNDELRFRTNFYLWQVLAKYWWRFRFLLSPQFSCWKDKGEKDWALRRSHTTWFQWEYFSCSKHNVFVKIPHCRYGHRLKQCSKDENNRPSVRRWDVDVELFFLDVYFNPKRRWEEWAFRLFSFRSLALFTHLGHLTLSLSFHLCIC